MKLCVNSRSFFSKTAVFFSETSMQENGFFSGLAKLLEILHLDLDSCRHLSHASVANMHCACALATFHNQSRRPSEKGGFQLRRLHPPSALQIRRERSHVTSRPPRQRRHESTARSRCFSFQLARSKSGTGHYTGDPATRNAHNWSDTSRPEGGVRQRAKQDEKGQKREETRVARTRNTGLVRNKKGPAYTIGVSSTCGTISCNRAETTAAE